SLNSITWEVQRFDGWYNNLAYHSRGATGSPLMRLLPARYSDGVYRPLQEPELPNARDISNVAMSGPSGLPSTRNQTVLSVFFGYHVVFEIVDSRRPGCPPEFMHISVPRGDPIFDPNGTGKILLPFQRGQWDKDTSQSPNNPRTQVNHVTAWIDGSSIYGSSSSWSDALRSFYRGQLAGAPGGNFPRQTGGPYFMWSPADPSTGQHGREGLYQFGNARGNENVFTVAEGIIWFRYHNYLASKLLEQHPLWSDEELFQNARKRVIATFQNIVFYEWLPGYLGNKTVPPYPGYQKYVDPGISPEFQSAAMRFGSTAVPPGVYMRNRTCHYRNIINIDGSTSPAMRVCNSFWNRQNPNLRTGQDVDDLMMGMASQIAEREDNIIVEDLKDYMYGPLRFSRSDLMALTIQRGRDTGLPSYNQARAAFDLPPVSSWEEINPELNRTSPQSWGAPGPLFSSIILDQFQRIRNGDRFWFENKQNGLFSAEEIEGIRNTTFHDVLLAVTSAEPGDIQSNVFFWEDGDPCPQPEQIHAAALHPCTNATTLDYFEGSQAGFGITITVLCLLPAVSFLLACLVAYFRKSKFKKFQKMQRSADSTEEFVVGITACEWQGPKEDLRPVGLDLDPKKRLLMVNSSGSTLRSLSLGGQSQLDILLSNNLHCRALLLKVPKEYDLVLFFEDESKRLEFVGYLQREVSDEEQVVRIREMTEQELLKEAVTREQRAQIVETFFRHAFAQVLEIEKSDAGDLSSVPSRKTREALQCELTASELASALGLKPNSLFVDSIRADEAIMAMLQAAGFDSKDQITWEDFHFLLRDHEKELQFTQLNVKGMEMQGRQRLNRNQRVSFISPQL
ncbi:hypothetical protein JZ751_018204, partial [Albula glossodonta]